MNDYEVTMFVKVGGALFTPYATGDKLAEVDVTFKISGVQSLGRAAALAWQIGQKISSAEITGYCDKLYPIDVRSLSVGDVIRVREPGDERWYAVEPVGWREINEPAESVFVPLAGSNATSRT